MRIPALAALALIAAPALAQDATRNEADLTKALAGRTAGPPENCLTLSRQSPESQIVGNSVIYRRSRDLWLVNRPDGGQCTALRPSYTIVSTTPINRLCRGDIIRIVEPVSGQFIGACQLGDFVPYTRDKTK